MEENLIELIEEMNGTENEIDMLVILGDVHHKHSQMDIMNNMRVTKFLTNISTKIPTYVLVGNHDIANNEQFLPEAHSLFSLKFCSTLTVVDRPMKIEFKGEVISMLPYLPVGRFYEGLDMIEGWQDSSIIFCHQEVRGVQLSKHTTSESSDSWPEENCLLVCGHVHTYQRVSKNLIYVGTPYSQNFAELDRKTVSVFTRASEESLSDSTDENTTPLVGWVEERLNLNIPGRLQVSCSISELESDPNILELIETEHPEGTKLKLRIRGTNEQLKHVKKLPIIRNLKEKYELTIQNINLEVFKPLQYEETEKIEDAFHSYLRNQDLEHLIPVFDMLVQPLEVE
jgi:DNA repair exonuclease SbcCD nuclease subunit